MFGKHVFASWCVLATVSLAARAQGLGLTPLTDPADAVRFDFHRQIHLNGTEVPPVISAEFFTHGALAADASNLRVVDGRRRPVPWKMLQTGPGDFAHVAIQTVPHVNSYQIEYGGDEKAAKSGDWTRTEGLVMETRRFAPCDLHQLPSVRDAFSRAEPMGSLYVPNVYLAFNPVTPGPEPFFSLFRGTLHAPVQGSYQFFTSSQDCSFLLIDGKDVVAAPGAHGPVGQARFKGTVTLTAGAHAFEYVHAASGPEAMMVAAWQPPGTEKPVPIPPQAFGSDGVAFVTAVGPFHHGNRPAHDMLAEVVGEVVFDEDAPPCCEPTSGRPAARRARTGISATARPPPAPRRRTSTFIPACIPSNFPFPVKPPASRCQTV